MNLRWKPNVTVAAVICGAIGVVLVEIAWWVGARMSKTEEDEMASV